MKRHFLLLASALIAMSSCQEATQTTVDPSGEKTINFSNGTITRVLDNKFEEGDAISVQAFDATGANTFDLASYTYGAGTFSSTTPISYTSDEAIELSYHAVYPAQAQYAATFSHAIAVDQSTKESYEAADLLVSKVAATADLKPALEFNHTMSNVILDVVVNRDGAVSTVDTYSNVKFHAQAAAACDIEAETYVGSGDVEEITPNGTTATFNAIVAPQDIAANGFATMTVNDQEVSMDNVAATLEAGYQYEITWTYDITTGTQTVEVSATIGEWNKGEWGTGDEPTTPATPVIAAIADIDGFLAAGETKTVNVEVSDLDGKAITAVSADPHFTVSVEGTVLSIVAAENTELIARNSIITVSVEAAEDVSFEVTQLAAEVPAMETTTYTFDYTALSSTWQNDADLIAGDMLWYLGGVNGNNSYGNIGLSNQNNGNLYNKIAFGTGVAEIVATVKDGSEGTLKIYAGTTQNPTEELTAAVEGNVYTYTLDGTKPFIKIENASTKYLNLDAIVVKYVGAIPATITGVNPGALSFEATGAAGQDVAINGLGLDGATIEATLTTGSEFFTASVTGTTLTVTPVGDNATDAAYDGVVTVSVNGTSATVAVSQKGAAQVVTTTTFTITTDNYAMTNSSANSGYDKYKGDQTIGSLGINSANIMVQSGTLQWKTTSGVIYSTSALKNVSKIKFTGEDKADFSVFLSTDELSSDGGVEMTGSDGMFTIENSNYLYFRIKNTGSTTNIDSIIITYEE